jgi:acyl phosphate:glycerol-3-phosphate acyltransferase
MTPALLVLLAYALGATPTSHWVGLHLFGVDLRTRGSGNLGATNTFRVLGWKAGVPVITVDILKGFVPTALFPWLAGVQEPLWVLAFGGAAILGHVFSFWTGFRGGKGVATSTGVFLALAPWAVLAGLAVWMAAVVATRYVSLGSVLAALVLPWAVLLTPHRGGEAVQAFTLMLALFIVWAHRENLGRLRRGEERRLEIGRPAEDGR